MGTFCCRKKPEMRIIVTIHFHPKSHNWQKSRSGVITQDSPSRLDCRIPEGLILQA